MNLIIASSVGFGIFVGWVMLGAFMNMRILRMGYQKLNPNHCLKYKINMGEIFMNSIVWPCWFISFALGDASGRIMQRILSAHENAIDAGKEKVIGMLVISEDGDEIGYADAKEGRTCLKKSDLHDLVPGDEVLTIVAMFKKTQMLRYELLYHEKWFRVMRADGSLVDIFQDAVRFVNAGS